MLQQKPANKVGRYESSLILAARGSAPSAPCARVKAKPRTHGRWATLRRTTWQRVSRYFAEIAGRPERGDVPGWVLITLMTAGLVVAIWAIAGPALEGLFNDAIARISSR